MAGGINPFVYALQNPTNRIDPKGLNSFGVPFEEYIPPIGHNYEFDSSGNAYLVGVYVIKPNRYQNRNWCLFKCVIGGMPNLFFEVGYIVSIDVLKAVIGGELVRRGADPKLVGRLSQTKNLQDVVNMVASDAEELAKDIGCPISDCVEGCN